jgi:hypothetical protein
VEYYVSVSVRSSWSLVLRLDQKGYLETIENALAMGDIVLFENIEESILFRKHNRGLFEKHKLVFTLQITLLILSLDFLLRFPVQINGALSVVCDRDREDDNERLIKILYNFTFK